MKFLQFFKLFTVNLYLYSGQLPSDWLMANVTPTFKKVIVVIQSNIINFNLLQNISYSYITSRSRISLLLHKTEGEAQGRVLITMISYEYL